MCGVDAHLDVIEEDDVVLLDGLLSPDQRGVGLGLLLLALLHVAHALPGKTQSTVRSCPDQGLKSLDTYLNC